MVRLGSRLGPLGAVGAVLWLFWPLLLALGLLVLIGLGCRAPTAPIERVHILCTVYQLNDSTITDRCR